MAEPPKYPGLRSENVFAFVEPVYTGILNVQDFFLRSLLFALYILLVHALNNAIWSN